MKKFLLLLLAIIFITCTKEEDTNSPTNPDPMDQNDPTDPVDPEPFSQKDIASVDQMVNLILSKYSIPGASLVVGRQGKLVYQKGYGYADKDAGVEVTPQSVFRLASVSKPYTAAGILKLVDEGFIALNDKIFGMDGLLGDDYGTPSDDRVYDITVDHLLYNTGGGWGVASGGDPIDFAPERNHQEFIEYVLEVWPLTHNPGAEYVYSNTGYWLLARVIERVSGMDYEDYLNEVLLKDTGITTLHSTNFKLSDKQPNEVTYYDVGGDDGQFIYDRIATRRDGDGGLISSAPDVLRFINGIDGFATKPDVFSGSTILKMHTPTPVFENWGRGLGVWQQQQVLYMYGSLPGTRTGWMRHNNGTSVVLLLNGNAGHRENFVFDIQDVLIDVVNKSPATWQDYDQFEGK